MKHLLTLLFALSLAGLASAQAPRPNVVVIFLDDAGYGDFGCFGHPTIHTPRIDAMAANGLKLTQFYSAFPVCTGSRYALMTGRYPARSGFPGVLFPYSERGLHADETTVAELFNEAGYATACIGKWHLGHQREFLPPNHGFDAYFGLPYSNDMTVDSPRRQDPPMPLIRGLETIEEDPDQRLLTRRYTEEAVAFIAEQAEADQPFFVYLPHTMPHTPLFASDAFEGQSPRGLYGDVIEEIDWSVGTVLDALAEQGVLDDTIVVLTSDNGPWWTQGLRGGSAGLLFGAKGSIYEGGVRVPTVVHWPNGLADTPRVGPEVAMTIDLLPTLCGFAGIDVPEGLAIDGVDVGAQWRGPGAALAERPLFFYDRGMRLGAVRRGPWKLYVLNDPRGWSHPLDDGTVPVLVHLERDPSERYNVADRHPELVAELTALIEAKAAEVEQTGTYWDAAP